VISALIRVSDFNLPETVRFHNANTDHPDAPEMIRRLVDARQTSASTANSGCYFIAFMHIS